MLSLEKCKTVIASRMKKQSRKSLYAFQNKGIVQAWLENLIEEYNITNIKDVRAILNALFESPFLSYEPIGQVAFNEPKVLEILSHYQVQR